MSSSVITIKFRSMGVFRVTRPLNMLEKNANILETVQDVLSNGTNTNDLE